MAGAGIEQLEPSHTVDRNATHFGGKIWQFLIKLKQTPCNPTTTLLDVYPSQMKTYIHTKI